MATEAPAFRKASAMAKPMPLVPPVTNAKRPLNNSFGANSVILATVIGANKFIIRLMFLFRKVFTAIFIVYGYRIFIVQL
jgi:hypothetical protein